MKQLIRKKNLERHCFPLKKTKQFCDIITEVHCDFRGAETTLNSNRKLLIECMQFKKDVNCKTRNSHEEISSTCIAYHPTWEQRIVYATHYDFNEQLIDKIAVDLSFTNKDFIENAKRHFTKIFLQ